LSTALAWRAYRSPAGQVVSLHFNGGSNRAGRGRAHYSQGCRSLKGEAVPSFAILTDEPNELVAPYHDRMPLVLGDVERWLNLDTTLDDVDPVRNPKICNLIPRCAGSNPPSACLIAPPIQWLSNSSRTTI
jgi:hypothetical protein